jgi:hypothetical protein
VRLDTVVRDDVAVLYAAAPGTWETIPQAAGRAFALLERAVPPRGRKMYGYWHPPALEYRACYALIAGDDAEALALATGVIPGGLYRRARLKDQYAFERIPEAFRLLAAAGSLDESGRPWLEFYRRHDEVELMVPITGETGA